MTDNRAEDIGAELVCVWFEPCSPEDGFRYSVTLENAHSLSKTMREWKCEPAHISTLTRQGLLVPVTLHSPVYYTQPKENEPLAYCHLSADLGDRHGSEIIGAVSIYGKPHREVKAALLRESKSGS